MRTSSARVLECDENQLTEFDVSNNSKLDYLENVTVFLELY